VGKVAPTQRRGGRLADVLCVDPPRHPFPPPLGPRPFHGALRHKRPDPRPPAERPDEDAGGETAEDAASSSSSSTTGMFPSAQLLPHYPPPAPADDDEDDETLAIPTPPIASLSSALVARTVARLFHYYANDFRFETDVITIRAVGTDAAVSKDDLGWSAQPMGVQDPYEDGRNLAGNLDHRQVAHIRTELAAAYRRFLHYEDTRNAFGPRKL